MRLLWKEIRVRAAAFADEWRDASYEKGETQSFYNDFFQVFGVRRRSVARYEEHVAKLNNKSGFIDLFWPGVLIVEQKSAGRDLKKAYGQAGEYFDALRERDRPRYILVSDFQTFELHDLAERATVSFPLADLASHVEAFGFIVGVQRRKFRDQDPANIEASELVGRLHDALDDAGYRGHDLERFLVRIVFCLFADDTGVFEPRDILFDFLESRTRQDGTDLGPMLAQLFQVLDTPENDRTATLDEELARFEGSTYPIGWLEPPVIPSNKLRILDDATLSHFAVLTSAMHMAWMRTVTGRLESRYQYSIGIVYNTFPLPPGFLSGAHRSVLEPLAQAILDARAAWLDATLADLYDPDVMPPNLRRAHQRLDRAVDRLYKRSGFASERERVEHLFTLYEQMRAPLSAGLKKKRRRRLRRRGA